MKFNQSKQRISFQMVYVKSQELEDYSSTGRKRPWKKRKKQTYILANIYENLKNINPDYFTKKAIKTRDCGTYLEFAKCPDHDREKRLKSANFCKGRLCPMCQWRRSMKLAFQINEVCNLSLMEQPKLRFLFLTLTTKNVVADKLEDEIDKMNYAFRKMRNRKEVDKVVEGYFKAVEVTYNSDKDNYNPHFHILLAVKSTYFNRNYIKQDRWVELWKQSLKVDYDPVVDIKAVKKKDSNEKSKLLEDKKQYEQEMSRAVAEVGKYSVKPDDYLDEDIEIATDVVETLEFALKGKRLATYGGLLYKIRQKLNMDDVEDENADLVNISDEDKGNCSICNKELIDEVYSWNVGLNLYQKN